MLLLNYLIISFFCNFGVSLKAEEELEDIKEQLKSCIVTGDRQGKVSLTGPLSYIREDNSGIMMDL